MAYCKNCGSLNNDGVLYCASCGAPMQAAQPQQPIYPVNNYQQPVPQSVPGKGLGITSMVLGIVGLVLFCFWYISIPCAIVGIILGCISKSHAKEAGMKNGMATAGIICSAIAIALAIVLVILVVVGMGAAFSELAEYGYYY